VLAGLALIMSARYPGGTLLAMATLGVLLHPAVGRALGPEPRGGRAARRRASVRGRQSALRPSRYDLVARHPIRGGSRTA
jgi:hypothetical protein